MVFVRERPNRSSVLYGFAWIRKGYAIVGWRLIVLAFWRFSRLFLNVRRPPFILFLSTLRIRRSKCYVLYLGNSILFGCSTFSHIQRECMKICEIQFPELAPVHPRIAIHLLSSCRFPGCAGFYLLYVCEIVGLPVMLESTEKKSLLHLRTYPQCLQALIKLQGSHFQIGEWPQCKLNLRVRRVGKKKYCSIIIYVRTHKMRNQNDLISCE